MEVQIDEPRTWITAVGASMVAVIAWMTKRQMHQWDKKQEELEKRVHELEQSNSRKAELTDIGAMYERLSAIDDKIGTKMEKLTDRMNEQHVEMLDAIYGRNAPPTRSTI